jgi:hypothetical protein
LVEGWEEHARAKVSQASARAPQAVGEAISEAGRHQQQRTRSRRSGKRVRNGLWAQGSRARAGSAPLRRAPRRRALAPAAPCVSCAHGGEMLLRRERRSYFFAQGRAQRPPEGRWTCAVAGATQGARSKRKERPVWMQKSRWLMRKALKKSEARTGRPGLTSGGGKHNWEACRKCSVLQEG